MATSSNPPPSPPPPLQLTSLPGRGRALITSRAINPGEVLLTSSPLLLYPSSFSSLSSFCSRCSRSLPSAPLPCPSCHLALFCSHSCLSLSHPHLLCRFLLQNPNRIHPYEQELLFLLSAYSLPPPSFGLLLSLHGHSSSSHREESFAIHSCLSSLILNYSIPSTFSPELTAELLARDRTNSFALMEPFREDDPDSHFKIRAYGVYPDAAFFNHDCLPNACRFDYVDDRNADIVVRAIHEVPEGREVCISYFPVNWTFKERQRRLLEDYGFRCECDRCRVEIEWKEDEMEEDEEDNNGDFPHAYFFVRFMCDRENCGGTLAPLPPSPDGMVSDVMECNVCGRMRKEEDVDEDDDVDGDEDMLDE
ncbi:histone-lysine N-methyltransferase ASHR2 [Typha latifolia]|uniref:histone-lysine N-methyltransferase ASHR2 n=1 Tax=Typha latifolia TaxID=4733 RepID=UPI003C2F6517